MQIALIPLRRLLTDSNHIAVVLKSFDEFKCEWDSDVEQFLNSYAISNEAIGASRTYLAIDEDSLMTHSQFKLVAFFTLAITVTDFTGVSNRYKRKIMGDYPRLSKETHFPGFLLGQLARDDRYSKEEFDCSNLLGYAERIIRRIARQVGGNLLYLDCKEPLVKYYEGHGYSSLSQIKNNGYIKMFKCLPRIELK